MAHCEEDWVAKSIIGQQVLVEQKNPNVGEIPTYNEEPYEKEALRHSVGEGGDPVEADNIGGQLNVSATRAFSDGNIAFIIYSHEHPDVGSLSQ